MTLAIKIGAGSRIFDDISIAYAMRGNQKLSITGTGVELKNNLTELTAKAGGISSIKATSDIVVSAAEVTTNKAALLKLGTRSLVLQQSSGTETDTNVNSNFSALDAIYTKFKSLNMTVAPTIDVAKINGAVNLVGMQNLSGKAFSVTGTGADIKTNINSILKNINQIDKIYITGSGSTGTATLTANQLRIIGDKINKSATATVVLQDTADNLLTTNNLALINKYNNTNLNPATTTNAVSSATTTVVTTASAHGLNTGDAVTWSGTTTSGTLTAGGTFFARKLSDTTFSLYTTNAAAVNTSVYTNQIVAGANITGSFTSQAGAAPVRVTTLNDVKVTSASIAQAQRFDALTAFSTGNSPVRIIPNIISQVDIADTIANLSSGPALAQTVTAKITTGGGAAGQGLMTVVGHGYSTGDAVTYSAVTTADGALTNNSTYYVGKSDSDKFALFTNKAAALAADYTSQTTLSGSTGYVTLNGSASGTETVTKLPTGADVSQNMTSASTNGGTAGVITLTGHGYKTGDAVTYSSTGTAMTGVVSGTTYFVGKRSDNTFSLFATRANALTADLSTDVLSAASTGFTTLSGAGSGVHKFTSSQLDNTMSAISRFKDGTGSVGRVTILGQGAVNVTDLNRIATQTNRGEGANNAYVAYSALGVDVNKNLQALYDNKTAGTAIDEIVVSDGTTTGKKAISLSSLMYNALKTLFTDGVEHPQGVGTNKNYAFTVSGASFGSASGLQSDANVATYAITGATYNDLTNPNTQLALELGRSKLKSLTSLSISDATQRSTITSLLNALGNPADRAKLKLTA
jgi:hypothetical protein